MSNTVMLNTRIDKTLKEHGMQVLNAQGISTAHLIRSVFEYMEANQDIPDCLKDFPRDKYTKRRSLLRSASGILQTPSGYDPLEDKYARANAKYEEVCK